MATRRARATGTTRKTRTTRRKARTHSVEEHVKPLELFFDLVFVFALTQVTSLMSDNPTWDGLAEGVLVLAALWWAWTAYAWLTNEIDPEEGDVRLAMFGAMAAMLVASLAVPEAFHDDALIFASAYFVVRIMHLVLFWVGSDDPGVQRAVLGLAPYATAAPALLIGAAFLDGLDQALVWWAALALDYAGPALGGMDGWRVSPGHFAERHGLIVIIALGESIVAIGVGAAGLELGAGELAAACLGITLVACLWWAYFDVVALVAEQKLRQAKGLAQVAIARDSYSYIHLPMIAGIVMVALGVKKTLGDVDATLETVPAVALCAGVTTYLAGHLAMRFRNVHTLNRRRAVAALVCLALIPLATNVSALVALGAVTAVCVTLIAYEAIRYRERRMEIRMAT
jgi:low temperature requirement protein LtrA